MHALSITLKIFILRHFWLSQITSFQRKSHDQYWLYLHVHVKFI